MSAATESDRICLLEQRQAASDKRQADLERRIADLERDAIRQMPWPAAPEPTWPSSPLDGEDARCGTCNGRFKDMSHYVCFHPQCPSRVTCTYGVANAVAETPAHLRGTTASTTTLGGPSMAADQLPSYGGQAGVSP